MLLRSIETGLDALCAVFNRAIAFLLAAMVIMVFGNVVLRYVFDSGITVSEELSRWAFVWLTFLGAIVAVREHGHLGTDFLVARLPVKGKKICLFIANVLMIYMCWLLVSGAWQQTLISLPNQAPASGWSMGIFYASGLVFGVVAGLMLIVDLLKLLLGKIKDEDLFNIKESEEQTHSNHTGAQS